MTNAMLKAKVWFSAERIDPDGRLASRLPNLQTRMAKEKGLVLASL
jgi:hypothetical protein